MLWNSPRLIECGTHFCPRVRVSIQPPPRLTCSHQPDGRSQPANPPRRVWTGPRCARLCSPGARVRCPGRVWDTPSPLCPQHVPEGCWCLLLLFHRWGGQLEKLRVPKASPPNRGEISGVGASLQQGCDPRPPSPPPPRVTQHPQGISQSQGGASRAPMSPLISAGSVSAVAPCWGTPSVCRHDAQPGKKKINPISPFCWDYAAHDSRAVQSSDPARPPHAWGRHCQPSLSQ